MISTKIVRIVKITGVILAALTFVGLMEDRIEFEKQKEIMGGHHIPAQSISAVGGDTAVHKDIPAAHAVRQTVPLTTQAAVVEKHRPVAGEPLSDDGIHIIFSTSCSMFQRWQAELLFYSHAKVKQRGSITRLVSGCKPPELAKGETTHRPDFFVDNGRKANVEEMHRSSNPVAKVYEPGSFKTAASFKFANKPYSVKNWVEKIMQATDQVVAILDPDQVLLKPITVENAMKASEMKVIGSAQRDGANIPSLGHPVGQHYPIGAAWAKDGHFNEKYKDKLAKDYGGKNFAEAVCGVGSPCTNYSDSLGQRVFALGPPYLLLHDDALKLGPAWQDFTPPVVDLTDRDLIADMWSYSMAAAHHNLPHTQIETFMVSNPWGSDEGFPYVLDAIKKNPTMSCHNPPVVTDAPSPTLLHFCQNIHMKDGRGRTWMYHKGHVPEHILECHVPLLKPPPDDFIATQTTDTGKRVAWNICQLYVHVNEMAMAYRAKYCVGQPINTSKVVFLHQYSNNCWQKDPMACFPFGTVEPEEYDNLPKYKYDV
eukprot:m.271785 g.271785  ORF g.271785 m.271785 type:complete len:539 (-) comp26878_c2_seq3:2097-3713(-)